MSKVSLYERLMDKTLKNGFCIEFTGSRTKRGYGTLSVRGASTYTHRVSWNCHNGPIPKGMSVCHRCDNPSCVNIDHLFLGTQRENILDCIRKGRAAHQKNPIPRIDDSHMKKYKCSVCGDSDNYKITNNKHGKLNRSCRTCSCKKERESRKK